MANSKRFGQAVLRLGCFVVAIGCFAAAGQGQPPASDDARIAARLGEFVIGQAEGKLPRDASFDALAPLLGLEGSGISIAEGRLHWRVPQRRQLTAAEQVEALAGLEALAHAGLAHAGLDEEAAEPLIAGSEISLLPRPAALSPLDLDYEAAETVELYLANEADRDRFSRPEFAALNRVMDFSKGFSIMVSPGQVTCRMAILSGR